MLAIDYYDFGLGIMADNGVIMSDSQKEITAKGFLCNQLVQGGYSLEEAMEAWDSFQAFVARRAIDDGYQKGFPALVFDGGGGTCIRIARD